MSRYFRDKWNKNAPLEADYVNDQTRRTLENVTISGGGNITRFGDDAIIKAGAGMAGNMPNVPTVKELPPIPTYGHRAVFWTSEDGGTGDNQVWDAYVGQARWTPRQNFTALDGTPIE
jgi:hypothetical protein